MCKTQMPLAIVVSEDWMVTRGRTTKQTTILAHERENRCDDEDHSLFACKSCLSLIKEPWMLSAQGYRMQAMGKRKVMILSESNNPSPSHKYAPKRLV